MRTIKLNVFEWNELTSRAKARAFKWYEKTRSGSLMSAENIVDNIVTEEIEFTHDGEFFE